MAIVSLFEYAEKIIELLKTNPELVALINTRTYTHVPAAKSGSLITFPYQRITIGGNEWDTKSEEGYDLNIELDIYSEYAGDSEVLRIIDAARGALQKAPIALTSGSAVLLRYETHNINTEADGKTHHGLVRFRALITT